MSNGSVQMRFSAVDKIFLAIAIVELPLRLQKNICPASVASTCRLPPLPLRTRPARGSKMRKRTSPDLVSNGTSEADSSANDGRNTGNILRLTAFHGANMWVPGHASNGWQGPCHFCKSRWFTVWIYISMPSTNGKGNWSSQLPLDGVC